MSTSRALLLTLFVNLLAFSATAAVAAPPDVSSATASVTELWSPNHKFAPVEIMGIAAADSDTVTVTVTGCTSDEPSHVNGGDVCPDAMMEGSMLWLCSERAGNRNGRVYMIYFEASNQRGEMSEGFVTVCVPHSRGNGNQCVDDGQIYDATDCSGEPMGADDGDDGHTKILKPNVPNPFNPVTRLSYTLQTETHVRLTIFDSMGRVVETLVNGVQPAGSHSLIWEATGQPSGVYFYRINAGPVVETRKMILLK